MLSRSHARSRSATRPSATAPASRRSPSRSRCELGWDRERIRSLRWAAPLHDVGKVKIRPQAARQVRAAHARGASRRSDAIRPPARSSCCRCGASTTRSRTSSSTTSAGTAGAIPAGLRGRAHPDRGADPRDRRRLRRDDLAAAVPARADARARARRGRATAPARSSTRSPPSSSSRPGPTAGTPGTPLRRSSRVLRTRSLETKELRERETRSPVRFVLRADGVKRGSGGLFVADGLRASARYCAAA